MKINNERLSKFSITNTLQGFIHTHSQIFSPKVNFLLSKKLLIDATETANINDIAYSMCQPSKKRYVNDSWMRAPKAQSVRKERYCFTTCLNVKSLSSNVHTLFKIKFEVIEIIMPYIVA